MAMRADRVEGRKRVNAALATMVTGFVSAEATCWSWRWAPPSCVEQGLAVSAAL